MPNPFTNVGRIEDSRYFFGRAAVLDAIFDRLNGVQLGSVNVVGERRIGRSSLLWHVKTIAPQRLPDAFCVGYLDLQSEVIDSPDAFRSHALHEWGAGAAEDSRLSPVPADVFESRLLDLRAQGLKLVVLLDEFESIVETSKAFSDTFFDGLRSLCNRNLLACVFVTRTPLSAYKTSHPAVSTLHGLCIKVDLGDFTEDEARTLLSQKTDHTFTPAQIQLARRWAGCHPLKLNLAANRIYEQRAHGQGVWSGEHEAAAEKKYRDDVAHIFAEQPAGAKVKTIGGSVWSGWKRFADWLESHKVAASLLGIALAALLLLLLGWLTLPQLVAILRDRLIGTTPAPLTPMP